MQATGLPPLQRLPLGKRRHQNQTHARVTVVTLPASPVLVKNNLHHDSVCQTPSTEPVVIVSEGEGSQRRFTGVTVQCVDTLSKAGSALTHTQSVSS